MKTRPNQTASERAPDNANSNTISIKFNADELAALRIEIDWIIAEYPDLGREGFAVRYIAPDVDREYLESEMFTVEVAKGLQLLAIQRVGVQPLCHSEEISSQFNMSTAAAIIACAIAGYRVVRIEGQRHAEILRAKKKRGATK